MGISIKRITGYLPDLAPLEKDCTIQGMIQPGTQIRLSFRPYRRKFAKPLRAAWGFWEMREGIILKLTEPVSGQSGFGEIAPLEDFGTESLEIALRHVFAMEKLLELRELESCVAEAPPATAFALRSAISCLKSGMLDPQKVSTSVLEEIGSIESALDDHRANEINVFKLKVGIRPADQEQAQINAILTKLRPYELLRLDPNQSWDLETWKSWTRLLTQAQDQIQFIEEPFNPTIINQEELIVIAKDSPVPLALDESISREGINHWIEAAWTGFWIIKPSLQGDPESWMSLLGDSDRVILSSAFETAIGTSSILTLAQKLPANAHGLGTYAWFDDRIGIKPEASKLAPITNEQMESIWNNLPED